MAIACPIASAVLRLDGTTAASYEQHSIGVADAAVAVRTIDPDGTVSWNGAARAWMNIDGHQTEVLLSAAHIQQAPTFDRQITQVALGADYNAPDEIRNVRSLYISPGFDRLNPFFSADLMVIVPEKPFTTSLDTKRRIANVAVGEVLSAATYDDDGTSSTGSTPQNGKRYSFDAVVRSGQSSAYSSSYSGLRFSTNNTDSLQYLGRILNHGSGSGSFNSAGQLVLINTGATSTTTIGFKIDLASDWIAQTCRSLRLPGDATYDERVNFDDLLSLARHYNQTTGATWADGDFTGDAAVNFDDLLILAKHYNTGVPMNGALSADFAAEWAQAQSLVPEPGTLMLGVVTLGPLTTRRRIV